MEIKILFTKIIITYIICEWFFSCVHPNTFVIILKGYIIHAFIWEQNPLKGIIVFQILNEWVQFTLNISRENTLTKEEDRMTIQFWMKTKFLFIYIY